MITLPLTGQTGPRYKQIADALAKKIEQGELRADTRLPTHRALAEQLGVTVGTVTRAYAEAARRGLIEARVGAGTYVCGTTAPTSWQFDHPSNTQPHSHFGYNTPPPLERAPILKQAMDRLSGRPEHLNRLMCYQRPEGLPEHRECFSAWLGQHGVQVDPARLLLTSGAQHALHISLSALCRAGDTLLVEKTTYPGLLSLARQHQLNLKTVDMDAQGLLPDALEHAIAQHQPRLLYCIPTLHNPTTATMPLARRQALLDICRRRRLYCLEDDVHGRLSNDAPPPLVNLDPEQVIHVGAFSKCLAPGLRVGYLQAPKALAAVMANCLQNHNWMTSPLLTGIAAELIQAGDAQHVLQHIRSQMHARLRLTRTVLSEFQLIGQEGAFHVWLSLPEHWRLSALINATDRAGLGVKSAEVFVPPGAPTPPNVRLSISAAMNIDALKTDLITLRDLLNQDNQEEYTL